MGVERRWGCLLVLLVSAKPTGRPVPFKNDLFCRMWSPINNCSCRKGPKFNLLFEPKPGQVCSSLTQSVTHLTSPLQSFSSLNQRRGTVQLLDPPLPTPGGLRGCWTYRQVLEQPGSQDVGGHFGEDSSFLVVQFISVEVVVVPSAGRRQAGVQAVTWNRQ